MGIANHTNHTNHIFKLFDLWLDLCSLGLALVTSLPYLVNEGKPILRLLGFAPVLDLWLHVIEFKYFLASSCLPVSLDHSLLKLKSKQQ